MAQIEWGPKNASTGKHSLQVSARFLPDQLKSIEDQVASYLREHSGSSRSQAVAHLAGGNSKVENRMEAGLDIINQLAAVDRTLNEVQGAIVVKKDPLSSIPDMPDATHTYYDLDLIPKTIEQPPETPSKKRKPNRGESFQPTTIPQPPKPEDSGELRYKKPSRGEKARRREEKLLSEERAAVEALVIDTGRENAEKSIEMGYIQIRLGDDERATIYHEHAMNRNPDGTKKFVPVDRKSGAFIEAGEKFGYYWGLGLKPEILRYCENIALELEGESPEPYKPEDLPIDPEDIYNRAVKAGVISHSGTPDGIVFFFQTYQFYASKGREIDLEKQVVKHNPNTLFSWNKYDRPVHPQFAEFLRNKKLELESQQNS